MELDMKRIFILLVAVSAASLSADQFWKTFSNGKGAEISSYKTVQPRYGELREAYTVLIFVPEHMNQKTRIKVENYHKIPKGDQIQIIKLNRVLKFNTGLYDYSVMTSVFTAEGFAGKKYVCCPFKISLSAQEWCGMFYTQLLPDPKGTKRVMHSYFEAEGDTTDYIKGPKNHCYEDNMFIRIREFHGPFMKTGEKMKQSLLPALWHSRMTHKPLNFEKGWLLKEEGGSISTGNGKTKVIKWTWMVGNKKTTAWTNKAYPHIIMKWKTSEGESGKLINTIYRKYWELKSNKDLPLRKELKLP
jgi:hypothetical protein